MAIKEIIPGISATIDTDNTNDIKITQRILKSLGYYTGDIDGDWGPLSKTAMYNFCKERMSSVILSSNCEVIKTTGWQPGYKDLVIKYSQPSGTNKSNIARMVIFSALTAGVSFIVSRVLSDILKHKLPVSVSGVIATYREPGFYKQDEYKGKVRFIPIDILSVIDNIIIYKMYGKMRRSNGYGVYFVDCDNKFYKVHFGRDMAYYMDTINNKQVLLKKGSIDYWKDLLKPCQEG